MRLFVTQTQFGPAVSGPVMVSPDQQTTGDCIDYVGPEGLYGIPERVWKGLTNGEYELNMESRELVPVDA